MNRQVCPRWLSSTGLNVALLNGLSVTEYVIGTLGPAWRLVPQALMPLVRLLLLTNPALQ